MSTTGSPAWKNPRERMAGFKKRKSSRCLAAAFQSTVSAEDMVTESCPPPTAEPSSASANPFKRQPAPKRQKVIVEDATPLTPDWDDTTAMDPFSFPSPYTSISQPLTPTSRRHSLRRSATSSMAEKPAVDFSNLDMDMLSQTPTVFVADIPHKKEISSSSLPIDHRLGTKLRVTSKVPFPWIKNIKKTGNVVVRMQGTEKHEGLKYFAESSHQDIMSSSSALVHLEAACCYWQFPCLPWLPLYPRNDSLLKTLGAVSAPPLAPPMLACMNSQWNESFDQLFLSWKKSFRHKFYMCCSTFTVIFTRITLTERDSVDDSVSCFQHSDGYQLIAIVTPTNMGFRKFLKDEGVEFELCSYKKRRLSKVLFKLDDESVDTMDIQLDEGNSLSADLSNQSTPPTSSDKENKEPFRNSDSEDDSPTKSCGAHDWLREMGVSPRNTKSLRRHRSMNTINKQFSGGKEEKDETSAVIVTGGSIQTLYNLLRTPRIGRSIAGIHANIPPTLLSEEAFLNGQLSALKKSSQVINRLGHGMEYVLELDGGPIMGHTVQKVVDYVRASGFCADADVGLRVNDRLVCAGLNGTENLTEWSDISVKTETVSWIESK